jgi:hypothetical protein
MRYLPLLATALLAGASSVAAVSAQTGEPVNADGSYVVANDDGVPIVSGAGDDIVYGDINTGGGGGEVLGDPSAVYSPMVPANDGTVPMMPGAGDGLIGGMPIQPQPAPADSTTTTTTDLATDTGTATENVPVEDQAPADAAPVSDEAAASDDTAASGGFCSQYATWYDAQVAYEDLGATAADPALVQAVDPDYDGIACEDIMV